MTQSTGGRVRLIRNTVNKRVRQREHTWSGGFPKWYPEGNTASPTFTSPWNNEDTRSFSTLDFHGSGDSRVVSWVPSYSYEGWIHSLIGWIRRSMKLLMTPIPFTSSSFL